MNRVHIILLTATCGAAPMAAQSKSSADTLATITAVAGESPPAPWKADTARSPADAMPSAASVPSAAPPAVLPGIHTHVTVKAREDSGLSTLPPSTVSLTGVEVLQSAGTWSDLPRYLQTLPGVVGASDTQNAFFVRGGNPFENLFLVDRIEVPNINHLALANSTGGLGSMLDTELVSNVTFQAGDTGSAHDSRLSSLTDIQTLDMSQKSSSAFDVGYAGAGFRLHRPWDDKHTLLLSVRESVTNLFLHDVGLNGSPEFTNIFARYTADFSSRSHLWLESLGGRDHLQVTPTWNDVYETNAYDTGYRGWRDTTGAVWQYTLSNDAVSTATVSNSESAQNLLQTSQLEESPSSFRQDNRDGATVLKYEYQYAAEDGSGSHFGTDMHINRLRYTIAQTGDLYSPYSASAVPMSAFALNPAFSTVDRAAFFDLNEAVRHHLFTRVGVRYQKSGLQTASSSTNAILPHASLAFAAGRFSLSGSWNRAAQLPPLATVAGAPGNESLGLIRSQQFVAGAAVRLTKQLAVNLEAYRKTYTGYPVSTLYPQVSLATLLPTITEPFTTLTLQSGGLGRATGLELSVSHDHGQGFFARGNVSLSRSEFTGRDGVYRPGTNDLPLVVNVMAGVRIRRYEVTARETATSGRPYTVLLPQASYAADRSIYDLNDLNANRGPLYNRLDFAVNRSFEYRRGVLRVHAGVLNMLNRQNFYEYLWRPRCPDCGPQAQYGTGLRPDFNISYLF